MRFQHGHAVALDDFLALVTDVQKAVVFNPMLHVPLSAQVNQLLAATVFQVQFVEAAAAR
ncbi:hypothetical protein AO240_03455 [Pseudomonas sp. ICMP 460]|nr:hypothetical protein [Pseudomonas sp. ICMP 460]PHN19469.1 hypothetical protein AO240_03455 [Pseudomonas sp. ICMP 460]